MITKNFFRLLVNSLIKKGKKSYSEKTAYTVLKLLKKELKGHNSLLLLSNLTYKIKPAVTLRTKKVAGILIRIPSLIVEGRDISLVVRWFTAGIKLRQNVRHINEKLVVELLDLLLLNRGFVLKKRNDLHRLALLNRPFLKYA